ncbi:hypothetical protein like AT1G68410 [Hibiscus trionum]|uniref:Uncharacterized protein n=1 Tax=Hibiscus trionum TaxID=183268 RepID=A0A9W7H3I6_HIBTR|nr:hypothetical protein like AT1G68410 [Hibiscus trionum]
MLAERLGNDEWTGQTTSGIFTCGVCQADLVLNEGISVHAGSILSTNSKPCQEPFLYVGCRNGRKTPRWC